MEQTTAKQMAEVLRYEVTSLYERVSQLADTALCKDVRWGSEPVRKTEEYDMLRRLEYLLEQADEVMRRLTDCEGDWDATVLDTVLEYQLSQKGE